MFWECYSYDKKSSFHIWKSETAKEKKLIEEELNILNKRLESETKLNWELKTDLRRMKLRNSEERSSRWVWNQKHEKITRDDKKRDIDWYRYQKKILIDKLLFFAVECMKDRSNTVIQEDKTSNHVFKHQNVVFMNFRVSRLLWSDNSSDLNMIESVTI